MSTPPAVSAVATWHDALAAGDPDRFTTVTDPDVEIVGPRGSAFGLVHVQDWARRSGIRLEPLRWFVRDDRVVVEQEARWLDAATGDMGEPVVLATAFTVRNGRISRIARFPNLPEALDHAAVTEKDAYPGPDRPTQAP